MSNRFYTVRTHAGITFSVEANSDKEAWQRASSPELGNLLANMMKEAISHVVTVEPHRGPPQTRKLPTFSKDVFKN
jgi:hypothetical protein